MSSPSAGIIEAITNWNETFERISDLGKSGPLALSPPLYKPDANVPTSVVVGIYAPGTGPLALELPEEDRLGCQVAFLMWIGQHLSCDSPQGALII